ncbi:MAG TPA: hypothetical protein VNM87_06290 [Candidatus Udaeobacter sp.]|nr:hypothetical protein [Candidatus Udaeobacter sp.]
MQRLGRQLLLAGLVLAAGFIVLAVSPITAPATPREVMLEDLDTLGPIENDIYHRAERPGAIVRVVPWVGADGSYSLIAVSEVGWVYQSDGGPGDWVLIGNIYGEWTPGAISSLR